MFSKLASIGSCGPLYSPEVQAILPPNWTILYAARHLTEVELVRANSAGVLTTNSSRAELLAWISEPGTCHSEKKRRAKPTWSVMAEAANEDQFRSLKKAWEDLPELRALFREANLVVKRKFVQEILHS